jgi:hypothetical protein
MFWILSNVAAVRIGVLPALPASLQWTTRIRLEYGLIGGAAIFTVGVIWAAVALHSWADVGFSAIDPARVMRSAIPSATMMVLGVELFFASFFLSLLRLEANRMWRETNIPA